VDFTLDKELKYKFPNSQYFSANENPNCDIMVSIGGDGTILRIAKTCAVYGVPIVGVNLGHMGFLAEEEPENIEKMVDRLVSGDYALEKRSLLKATTKSGEFLSLNDTIVTRNLDARMLEVEVRVNNEFVDSYSCDGYIVSTPTGSTAYSLSAGGSILSPSVSAFILTSINSHSLHSRPIVVSKKDDIELKPRCRATLVADGDVVAQIEKDEEVKVVKYEKEVAFVRFAERSFYKKLLTKLNKWSVTDREE
ncbi:MAG: NAD(+)/NADH kinase, partial [Clostridia bacterium]|nr:NAD(+)/NADH kinase [Clostridia bacterium]